LCTSTGRVRGPYGKTLRLSTFAARLSGGRSGSRENLRKGAAMERGEFVAEGHMQLGPTEYYFVFLEGEYLGKRLCDHFGVPEEHGYTEVGRVRITVEMLEASQT
jgi:hypothetical protein